ncbi:MAG: hypothetical protein KDI17_12425 [Halioglobus sp.]|nr:hypothetical protein [Halioglobus sp.]
MVLLLIGGIPVTVILAATWLWFFVARGELDLVGVLGTANRGTLVQPPRQLDDYELLEESGAVVRLSDMEPRWTMVIPATGGRCDESCEKTLYLTRQIHVAMGKEFNRLQRLYISEYSAGDTELAVATLSDDHPAPGDFAQYLATEHRGLQALIVPSASYKALFPEHQADPATWYLMDPAGWIMMSYNDDVSYKDVIADLKFLLKNSGG